jgi:hypothetical protein
MLPATLTNLVLTVNGQNIQLPVEMRTGSWVECNDVDDCTVYGSRGETLTRVKLHAPLPSLRAGSNELRLACASGSKSSPRVKVMVFSVGEEL